MFKNKLAKAIFVVLCIVTLLVPYASPVLAVKVNKTDTQVNLKSITAHEGGDEASGTLNDEQEAYYDKSIYEYYVGGTDSTHRVWKIVTSDTGYQNSFYCLNATKTFPAVLNGGNDYLAFDKVANMKDSTDPKVKALHMSAESSDSATWNANYKALLWIFENIYLKNDLPGQKDEFLNKAFKDTEFDVETVKAVLTDDDIDVVQQYAIWYFTNNDYVDGEGTQKFNVEDIPAINISKLSMEGFGTPGSYSDVTGKNDNRQEIANTLYKYLINSAKNAGENTTKVYPTLTKTESLPKKTDKDYYVVGPYKVTSGNVDKTEYSIKLVDQNNNDLTGYRIKINGEDDFTADNLADIVNKDFYVYIPKTNTDVSKVKLKLEYNSYETIPTLWENSDEQYQPVVLVNREMVPHSNEIEYPIERPGRFDLALRKYLVKVNNTNVSMAPNVDTTPLKNGETDAIYKHAKTPINVAAGDKVIFEIRVYNEGDVDATSATIKDQLPKGLKYVEDSEINTTYGWQKVEDTEYGTIYKTDYIKNTKIDAYNKENDELTSKFVQIECEIANNVTDSSVLTNIAEIMEAQDDDGNVYDKDNKEPDSTPENNEYVNGDKDPSDYRGNENNKSDLTDENYYYKGEEDDDDFSKVKIKGHFDLALQKFITKVNDTEITNRTPVPRKNSNGGLEYSKQSTDPLKVEYDDLVTYTIRVYNEGEIAGYAKEILDTIPAGLEYVLDNSTNTKYGWVLCDENGEPLEDQTDVKNAKSVKTAYLSKEKSEDGDYEALLNPFDKTKEASTVSYKDVQIVFKVVKTENASATNNKTVINIAEITDDEDKDGKPVEDDDSKPDNKDEKPNEDDTDRERIIVKELDLALRKYIVKANGKNVDMAPTVDSTPLKNGENNAIYKHAKTPVEVKQGNTIVFEIRVYNEGEIDTGTTIIDALPDGLEYVENSSINTKYGWKKVAGLTESEDGSGKKHENYETDYLKNRKITAYDSENDKLSSDYVQIECRLSDDATAASILTNIAEISTGKYPGESETEILTDRDSNINSDNGNNDYINTNLDSTNYTGDKNNKEDLTDKDYFYKGLEDDDDFAKIKVVGKSFDLNLKKFITKINGEDTKTSREPKVDLTKLKNGTSTDAEYVTVKTPLKVSKGDIITYKIRVYNEGEKAGYAEEVADYLPEGLGFLVNYKANTENMWSIPKDSKTVKLSTIENGTKNLKVADFNNVSKLEDVDVVTGKAKITSTLLSSSTDSKNNLLKAFDKETGRELDFRDIEVTCIVIADQVSNNNMRNIGEVIKQADEKKNEIPDIDSTPNTVDPNKYPDTEKRPDGTKQDDNDYEDLTIPEVGKFDLSLQKFITKLNDTSISGREPKVAKTSDGKLQYIKSVTDPLAVENNDLVTYTIRVYNEGNIAGYAKEISDNIPNGLEFVESNETNKKYGWKLYDKNGNETTNVKQATMVKTNYLSKSASEAGKYDALLKAFDSSKSASTLSYKDIEIVFKVVESDASKNEGRNVINIAEITDDEDENGNPVVDQDSVPGNNKPGEDDIDQEKVYVKYFDLALNKRLSKIVITENGTTREIAVSTDSLQKVEIHRKKIDSTVVKFIYDITVKNEGQISGYAQEITDNIPDGLEFIQEDNKVWSKTSDKEIKTEALANTLLKPGESASVQVSFKWKNGENNMGLKTNIAEITADRNDSNTPDRDSVPGNNKAGEDDIDDAQVMLAIATGKAPTYFTLALVVVTILATGIVLIKKYVL